MSIHSPRPAADWFQALPPSRLLAEISLWSANLGELAASTKRIEPYTDMFHVDVADGHFSPAMLFFPDLLAAVRQITAKPIHVHLMTADSILMQQVEQFAETGADLISVHVENENAMEALAAIRKSGLKAGIVLQLHTPVSAAKPFLPHIDLLTLLGTRIGVKGQGLDENAGNRTREARTLAAGAGPGRRIIVAADGGIREHTVPVLRTAGAETVVMGSLAFGATDLPARFRWLHGLTQG